MTKSDTPILDEANTTLFNYDQWRGKFLNVVLWVVCGLGIFLILPNTVLAEEKSGNYGNSVMKEVTLEECIQNLL